jgi:hypothetical protein
MLTHKIEDQDDHDKLKTVFDLLRKRGIVATGLDVHSNNADLEATYGGGR